MYGIQVQAVCAEAFSTVYTAVEQRFIDAVMGSLNMINQKQDEVLKFLHGEKKADLISKISFVQYACKNYSFIMEYSEQRTAVISNLQSIRRLIVKDAEYYLCVLDEKTDIVSIKSDSFFDLANDALEIKETLDVLMQMFVMCTAAEGCYAQNNDVDFLKGLKSDMSYYINNCCDRILASFDKFNNHRIDSLYKKISEVITSLENGKNSKMNKIINFILQNSNSIKEFYIDNKGEVYIHQ